MRNILYIALIHLFVLVLGVPLLPADLPAQVRSKHGATTKKPPIAVESTEGIRDTITFHVGSPLFLRFTALSDARVCTPFNGQFFFFDAAGTQLGWGFEEVADSLLFPRRPNDCGRIVMLSSEHSNRLAEGYYTMKATVFIDSKNRISSNTIILHPIHSLNGADSASYLRFLQEQLLKNSALLRDPETLKALFDAQKLVSAESQIYRAVALYKLGDMGGVDEALRYSNDLAAHGSTVSPQVLSVKQALLKRIASQAGK